MSANAHFLTIHEFGNTYQYTPVGAVKFANGNTLVMVSHFVNDILGPRHQEVIYKRSASYPGGDQTWQRLVGAVPAPTLAALKHQPVGTVLKVGRRTLTVIDVTDAVPGNAFEIYRYAEPVNY